MFPRLALECRRLRYEARIRRRAACGGWCAPARTEDVRSIGFDEGPVFPESFAHFERRGVEVVRDLSREEAVAVLNDYRQSGGLIYNP